VPRLRSTSQHQCINLSRAAGYIKVSIHHTSTTNKPRAVLVPVIPGPAAILIAVPMPVPMAIAVAMIGGSTSDQFSGVVVNDEKRAATAKGAMAMDCRGAIQSPSTLDPPSSPPPPTPADTDCGCDCACACDCDCTCACDCGCA
jgi:hypothetical protein